MRRTLLLTALVFARRGRAGCCRRTVENPSLPVGQRVNDLLSRMTLAEKVGQMTQTERAQVSTTTDADHDDWPRLDPVRRRLDAGRPNTPEAWADMVDRFQRAALATRLHIPLLYGIDSVHGNGNLLGATVFPHNIGLGATRDPALVRAGRARHRRRDAGDRPAVDLRAVHLRGPRRPLGPHVRELRRGPAPRQADGDRDRRLQGTRRPGGPDRVLATAKHYAGDGDTDVRHGATGDYTIDQGIAITSRAGLLAHALRQYVPAVRKHDVGTVMPSFSSVDWTEDGARQPDQDARPHGADHRRAQGQAWASTGSSSATGRGSTRSRRLSAATQVRTGVNAGIDMFMEPERLPGVRRPTLIAEVRPAGSRRRASTTRSAGSCARSSSSGCSSIRSPTARTSTRSARAAHRAVARKAVAESQVLLKNTHRALPLAKRRRRLRRRPQRRQHRQPGRRLDAARGRAARRT